MSNAYLYNLCINAVWTTFGCCDDVAAAALTPFVACPVDIGAVSVPATLPAPIALSTSGLLCVGGPIEPGEGAVSIGSP